MREYLRRNSGAENDRVFFDWLSKTSRVKATRQENASQSPNKWWPFREYRSLSQVHPLSSFEGRHVDARCG